MIDPELFPAEASRTQRLRLFCFPHAGGGTSAFYRWRRYVGDVVNIIPARLPGRESRLNEPPVASMMDLAATVAATIESLPPGPFALLGYSVGAHLAHHVARMLPRRGQRAPQALVVVASNAPGTQGLTTAAEERATTVEELPDDQLVEHIHQKYGGIPAVVRNDPSWLAAVVPALRADLRMLRSLVLEPCDPLECPLLAIGGVDDAFVTAAGLAGWGKVTTGALTTQQFRGGHFFLYQDFNSVQSSAAGRVAPEVHAALVSVLQFVLPVESQHD